MKFIPYTKTIYNFLHFVDRASSNWFLANDQRDAQIIFYSLLPTCTHLGHQHRMTVIRGCIDTICLSWWWALCARNMWRVINRNKYTEKNLCITLVIYQESIYNLLSLWDMTKCCFRELQVILKWHVKIRTLNKGRWSFIPRPRVCKVSP
jgi:uncharacterized membrane protein YwzB